MSHRHLPASVRGYIRQGLPPHLGKSGVTSFFVSSAYHLYIGSGSRVDVRKPRMVVYLSYLQLGSEITMQVC